MICDLVDEFVPIWEGDRGGADHLREGQTRPRQALCIDCARLHGNWVGRRGVVHVGPEEDVRWYIENRNWSERVRSGEYRSWIREQYGE